MKLINPTFRESFDINEETGEKTIIVSIQIKYPWDEYFNERYPKDVKMTPEIIKKGMQLFIEDFQNSEPYNRTNK